MLRFFFEDPLVFPPSILIMKRKTTKYCKQEGSRFNYSQLFLFRSYRVLLSDVFIAVVIIHHQLSFPLRNKSPCFLHYCQGRLPRPCLTYLPIYECDSTWIHTNEDILLYYVVLRAVVISLIIALLKQSPLCE